MKHFLLLFSILLITNCYSYKTVNGENPEPFKKYVLYLKNSEKLTVENLKKKEGSYYFSVAGAQKTIPETEVSQIKLKQFSYWKTILLIEGVGVGAIILILRDAVQNMKMNPNLI